MFGNIVSDTGDVGMNVLRTISDLWRIGKADSLIEYTRAARVEALTIVDSALVYNEDELMQILQSLQSMFSGYYLQAMAISTNVGAIDIMRQLEKLSPNRSPGEDLHNLFDAKIAKESIATESYIHRLPTRKIALEADNGKDDDKKSKFDKPNEFDKDNIKFINEMNNLSIGKLLSVRISDGERSATIPVSIRLMVNAITSNNLVDLFGTAAGKLKTFTERRIAWKMGRLEFIRDILWCEDVISQHKRNSVNDKTGLYKQIRASRVANGVSSIISQNPTVARASNLLVMAKETLTKLENETSLRFNSFKDREKVFEGSGLMIVAVYDKDWDRVEFFHRGIESTTTLTIKNLKASNKGTGPDVADILKAYQLGNSPTI